MDIDLIPFPKCCKKCSLVTMFGVSECESCCPHKFDENGDSLSVDDLTKKLSETRPAGEE